MENNTVRKPAVAGQFYPSSPKELKKQIDSYVAGEGLERVDAIACVLPHAGYIYSGAVAARTLASIDIKNKILLLGPNHTGYGEPFSLMAKGSWETPFGKVNIDTHTASGLLKACEFLREDTAAHAYEHSLEVELPLLQYFKPDISILPLTIGSTDPVELKKTGNDIASCLKNMGLEKEVLIVASSDMTHYESAEIAQKKDRQAIEAILELDEDKLLSRIAQYGISMCGFAPVTVMLSCAKALGAKSARLITYATSGDVTQDTESVVGYAGMVIL